MVGRTISHYQLVQRLGAGGMGEIYLAQDTQLARNVAIKVLLAAQAGDDDRRRRFLQEARAASALNHPNIITIYDIVFEGDAQYMVMEYVAGKTLADLIPPGGLPISTVCDYAVQIADALGTAHAAGIVHRDLKPGNIMIVPPGRVKILDFGLAKRSPLFDPEVGLANATASVGPAPLTIEGSIIGTVSYMSPEQADGKPVDARSDIFSFGVVLYEMVTGRQAFKGDSLLSTLSSILRDEARPISEITAGVPPLLEQVIKRCLAKDPAARWQSMQEMRAGLLWLQGEPWIAAPRPALVAKPRGSPRVALAAGMIAALGACVAGLWIVAHRNPAAPAAVAVPAAAPAATPDAPLTAPPVVTTAETPAQSDTTAQSPAVTPPAKSTAAPPPNAKPTVKSATKAAATPATIPENPPANAPAAATPPVETKAEPKPTPFVEPPPKAEPAPPRALAVPDGLPFHVRLAEDIPSDVEPGQLLHFTVVSPLRIGAETVVAAGAKVTGEVVEGAKRKLIIKTTKVTFRLKDVAAVDGSKLAIRAVASADGKDGAISVAAAKMAKHPKEVAAPAGTEYVAYSSGAQSVKPAK